MDIIQSRYYLNMIIIQCHDPNNISDTIRARLLFKLTIYFWLWEEQNLTEDDIMKMAESKIKKLVQTWEWNVQSKEQKEFFALYAKLETITRKKKMKRSRARTIMTSVCKTKPRNGKTYHWWIEHQMSTHSKAGESKLYKPKEVQE